MVQISQGLENFEAERKAMIAKAENQMYVKYYRPACNHCKALAPKWEAMAESLVERSDIGIFEVQYPPSHSHIIPLSLVLNICK